MAGQVIWHGPELIARVRSGAMKGLEEWIGMVDDRAVQLILSPPKTGRIYLRRGVAHQASAPGEAPASDTGALVSGREIRLFPERLAARLTFTSGHALYLERGTRKMEPRPFALRSVRETEKQGQAAVSANIGRALK